MVRYNLPRWRAITSSKWRDIFSSSCEIYLPQVARLVCILLPIREAKLLCCRRPAGGNQLSTGQLNLVFRVSPLKRKKQGWHKPSLLFWSKWRDSNSRHPAPKAGALPTALHLDKPIFNNKKQARFLLRCPASSSATERHPHLPTAATRAAPLLRHRRRSPCSPTALHLDRLIF